MNNKGKNKKNQELNIFEEQEIIAKAEVIKSNLKASTWHELETKGKFSKNEKLSFVSDNMLAIFVVYPSFSKARLAKTAVFKLLDTTEGAKYNP